MATDVLIIVTYVCYGLVATAAGNAVAFAVTAGPYLIVALVLVARHRRSHARPTAGRGSFTTKPPSDNATTA